MCTMKRERPTRRLVAAPLLAFAMGCTDDVTTPVGPVDAAVDAPKDVVAQPDAPPTCTPAPRKASGSTSVAYQINATHVGHQASDQLSLPLCKRWSKVFTANERVSYPVVADGRVYFTVTLAGQQPPTTQLFALDAVTGNTVWGPTKFVAKFFWSALAYDAGHVYLVSGDGKLTSFDGATGAVQWQFQAVGQTVFTSAPTVWGGKIYLSGYGSGGTVYAVNQANGSPAWSAPVEGGNQSSPAVDATGVYVSYHGPHAYAFDPSSGTELWHHTSLQSGGTGQDTALMGGRLYVRDVGANMMLSAVDGSELGPFTSTTIPAFVDSANAVFVSGGAMQSRQLPSMTQTWSFAGDGKIVTAPLVVGAHVVVGSSTGMIYAVDAATGAVASSDDVGAPIDNPELLLGATQPLPGLAEADGLLFVAARSRLVVY